MPFVIADRVQETSTTTGTGNFTLAGAVTGFRTFSAGVGSGNNTWYCIAHQTLAEWEVGYATMVSGTVLGRTNVLASSNAGSAVNFSAGTKSVFVTLPSARSITTSPQGTTGGGIYAPNSSPFTSGRLVYASAANTAQSTANITTDGSNLFVGSVLYANSAFYEQYVDYGSGSNISSTSGNYARLAPTGSTAYSISPAPLGPAYALIVQIVDGGSYAITWGFAPVWPGGTAPTLTVGGTDILGFYTPDSGATWYGFTLGLAMA